MILELEFFRNCYRPGMYQICAAQYVGILELSREIIYLRIYYEGIGLHVLETENSQDLPPVNWTPREVGGVVHSESKGLRTSLRTETMRRHVPLRSEAGKRCGFLFLLFVWFQPSTCWMISIGIVEGYLLFEDTSSDAHLFQKHPYRHTQKQCSIWTPSGSQVDT